MLRRIRLIGFLEAVLALLLAVLVIVVFVNVVLRGGFNAGFAANEEIARLLLVWLVMLGAVLALHDRAHIAMTGLVARLPALAGRIAALAGLALMMLCDWLLFRGALTQYRLSAWDTLPVTGLPMDLVYLSGIVAATGLFVINGGRFLGLLLGRLDPRVHFAVSDPEVEAEEAIEAEQARGLQR